MASDLFGYDPERKKKQYTRHEIITGLYRVLGAAQDRYRATKDKRWQRADDIIRDQIASVQTTGALCRPNEKLRHAAPDARNATDGQCGVA